MRLRSLVLVVCLSLMIGSAPLAAQETSAPSSALLNLLRYVPDMPVYREFLTYGDKAAWLQSWDVPNIQSFDALDQLDKLRSSRWMFFLTRQTMPPNALAIQYLNVGDDRIHYGFDFFETDRYLEAGQPPNMITVVDGPFDAQRIDRALTASGYKTGALDPDGMLYSLRGDYETDMKADLPMVGKLATRNRIALFDNRILIANATPILQNALSAYDGKVRSLADSGDYRAAVAAFSDDSLSDAGALVGAIFIGQQQLGDPAAMLGQRADADQVEALKKALDVQPGLPLYSLTAFATFHTPGTTSLVLAVVFPKGIDAQAAADALGERIQHYTSLRVNRPLLDAIHARFDRAIGLEADGQPVALIVLQADDPGPDSTSLADWSQIIFMRDTGFLLVNP